MTLDQLRYFQAVCKYKSVSNASKYLNISQPSVSNAISKLENEFGIMLFVRQYAEEIDFKTACDRLTYTKADRFTAGVFAIGGKYLGFEKEADLYNSAKGNSLTECDDLLSDILCAGVYGGATMARRHSAQMTWDAVHGKKKRLLHRLFPPLKELDTRFDYARKAPVLLPVAWIHRLFIYLARTDKKGVSAPLETLHLASERTELLRSLGLLDG